MTSRAEKMLKMALAHECNKKTETSSTVTSLLAIEKGNPTLL
jgi:hypothetical protein